MLTSTRVVNLFGIEDCTFNTTFNNNVCVLDSKTKTSFVKSMMIVEKLISACSVDEIQIKQKDSSKWSAIEFLFKYDKIGHIKYKIDLDGHILFEKLYHNDKLVFSRSPYSIGINKLKGEVKTVHNAMISSNSLFLRMACKYKQGENITYKSMPISKLVNSIDFAFITDFSENKLSKILYNSEGFVSFLENKDKILTYMNRLGSPVTDIKFNSSKYTSIPMIIVYGDRELSFSDEPMLNAISSTEVQRLILAYLAVPFEHTEATIICDNFKPMDLQNFNPECKFIIA
jgi:hypothetical protein